MIGTSSKNLSRAVVFLAALSCLSLPATRVAHAEVIFVSDPGAGVVKEYTDGGAFVASLTAGVAGGFNPRDLTLGADGMLYAVNFANSELEKFDPRNGQYIGPVGDVNAVSISLGLGAATAEGVTLGPDGDLYVLTTSGKVFKIDPAQGTNAAGTTLFLPQQNANYDLAFSPNNTATLLAMGNSGNMVINDTSGSTFATGVANARGITFGPDGRLYIADRSDIHTGIGRILVVPATGGATTVFASSPVPPPGGQISFQYLDFDSSGNLWATTDFNGSGELLEFNGTTGAFIQEIPTGLPALDSLASSLGVAVGCSANALGLLPGQTQGHPVLPITISTAGQSIFTGACSGYWFDPLAASGFDYQMTSGSLFTEVDFPTGFSGLTVSVGGTPLGTFGPGGELTFPGAGVSEFEVTGINPPVDGTDPTAFPLQLVFNATTADFTMTALGSPAGTAPEPGTLLLLCSGLIGLLGRRNF